MQQPPASTRSRPARSLRSRVVAAGSAAVLAAGLAATGLAATGLAAAPGASAAPRDPEPAPRVSVAASSGVNDARLRWALRQVAAAGAIGVVADVRGPAGTWTAAAGRAETWPHRAATPDARFRSASTTKMLTAVLVMTMVERGRWTLDTTVDDVVPGLLGEHGDTTVRELLSHTSGLPDYAGPLLIDEVGERGGQRAFLRFTDRERDPRDLVARGVAAWAQQPEAPEQLYSNTGFVALGVMLREATGVQQLERLYRQWIFVPAGMRSSSYAAGPGMPARSLTEYATIFERTFSLRAFNPQLFDAAGALVTTTTDLNRFHNALSRGRLVSRASLALIRTPVATTDALGPYGLGTYAIPGPCGAQDVMWGHDGATFGTLTLSFTSPDARRKVTVAMTNRNLDDPAHPSNARLLRFMQIALGELCEPGVRARTEPGRGLDVPTPSLDAMRDLLAGVD